MRGINSKIIWEHRFILAAVLLLAGLFAQSMAGQADEKTVVRKNVGEGVSLIMFEQEGCHFCEVWNTQVGVTYPKSPEGKFAPLIRKDIHTDDKVPNVRPVVFTPTFVVLNNGQEVGRLTGYISEDFFWGLLLPLLKKQGFKGELKESRAN